MSKNYMIVNGHRVEYTDEKNILDVVRKDGIELPTFCYYSELSIYGACRMCMVEDEKGNIIASCSTPPKNGMSIKTHTPKLQKHRKTILELLLASNCQHNCTTCEKSGKCRLQELAHRFAINEISFVTHSESYKIDDSSKAIIRDPNKCILCGDCVRMCSEIQNVGAIDFILRGSKMQVSTAFEKPLSQTDCVNCGQCCSVCPTGAIVIKKDISKVWEAIYNPDKKVIVQIAPAVRVALGEEFGFSKGKNVMGYIVSALRKIGFDAIYDTAIGADMTVEEESKEFMKRIESGNNIPLFTSCCPAWVRYVEKKHPELLKNISTCRSPMEMFGAMVKKHSKINFTNDRREPFVVAIMPCTAKKYECDREEFKKDNIPYVDCVITTQELVTMLKETGIKMSEIESEAPDMPFGLASGSGVIFGVTGGVTESVIRRLNADNSPLAIKNISSIGVRGLEGIKEFSIESNSRTYKFAVVSGLSNAETIIKSMENGTNNYDFIEVMACQNGCISGGGQPFALNNKKVKRAMGIYDADRNNNIKRSDENPMLLSIYNNVIKDEVHKLLHVDYCKNKLDE